MILPRCYEILQCMDHEMSLTDFAELEYEIAQTEADHHLTASEVDQKDLDLDWEVQERMIDCED